jgi:hypothetical protein
MIQKKINPLYEDASTAISCAIVMTNGACGTTQRE